jgi:hypothetical protein
MNRMTTLVSAVAAVPCLVLALVSAWWYAEGLAGGGLWPPDEVTLSEAIATRNTAEALRLIQLGASPDAPSRVRAGLLTADYDVTITPVEAAVGAQRADALRMLLANGANIDARELRVLRCYENVRRDGGVRDILEARASTDEHGTSSDAGGCTGVRLPGERGAP